MDNYSELRRKILMSLGAAGLMSFSSTKVLAGSGLSSVKLGVTNLSFHRVTAAVVAQVMSVMGKQVIRSYDLHEANFNRLKDGNVDFVSSAWLPYSHGLYQTSVEETIPTRELGLHYQPYALWGVPDYVPVSDVEEIGDLLKPDVIAKMRPFIQGIGEGAGITRFSKKIMLDYELSASGYQFRTGTQADCVAAFEAAVAVKDWVIVPLWHPQFLHHQYKIRELGDPKYLLGGKDRAVLLAREDSLNAHFTSQQIAVLDNIHLSNEIVAELDYGVNRLGLTEDEAAAKWLTDNPTHLAQWLEPLMQIDKA
ncbi:glycine/betaine ABC transporter [Shewanella sp. YLB-07]|nr:glycine/betaine ABC transporter [Shewanella sp. YLB-07]